MIEKMSKQDQTEPQAEAPTKIAGDYRSTLNLPRTNFEMKANLTQREPGMLAQWKSENLYKIIRGLKHPKGKWVLHDGPPYANGDIHMGTLLNKVLKDIVVKYRTMQGHDSPYVPGWDCHGLPIESAIQKELGPKIRTMPVDEIRRRCREYALKYVHIMSESFQRLGVFGDFARPYLTMDPAYEAGILNVLAKLVGHELVFRQLKPVHWCTFDQTALAEAELEYSNRKDASVYVKFEIDPGNSHWPEGWRDVPTHSHLLIWTTTPWTLPANRAVAVHPEHQYVCISSGAQHLIVAAKLAPAVSKLMGTTDVQISAAVSGNELCGIKYRHPLDHERIQPVVPALYVTLEDGTGLVHTAPGHGMEDYQTAKRQDLEIYCPVQADGRYDQSAPEFLRGKLIWDANNPVVEHLQQHGLLLHRHEIDHSYPHCWRCRKPVIFRATEQWFIRANGESHLVEKALAFVDQVQWIPHWGKSRIVGMLQTRPDWCISRQRHWGVPIPAFFAPDGTILLTEKSVQRTAEHIGKHGADAWFTHSPEQILNAVEWVDKGLTADGTSTAKHTFKTSELRKGTDILDVWFESGASHHAVLEQTHPELGYPASMYLEGSDQHRGWFQSSLLEAAGYRDKPPFAQVLTHGFIVDAAGRKMSKSEGNDIKVTDALKENGADVLRLWAASVDYQNDIPCSKELLSRTGEAYRKIRNTIRYLLGNLYDFDDRRHRIEPQAHSIDTWMQHRLAELVRDTHAAFDRYEFHRVFRNLYEFCNVDISAVYAKAIKDRLYCELPDAPRRRASQTLCARLLMQLIELSAPILAFTAEEAWQAALMLPGMKENFSGSIHGRIFSEAEAEPAAELVEPWRVFMPLVDDGLKQLDDLKRKIGLGNPLDAEAVIVMPQQHPLSKWMDVYGAELEDVLGVGYHRVEHGEIWAISIHDTRQRYASCARSWKRRPDVGSDPEYPDLSARDARVVRELKKREKI
jgi:isoleucyl-tRNA synthetase